VASIAQSPQGCIIQAKIGDAEKNERGCIT